MTVEGSALLYLPAIYLLSLARSLNLAALISFFFFYRPYLQFDKSRDLIFTIFSSI